MAGKGKKKGKNKKQASNAAAEEEGGENGEGNGSAKKGKGKGKKSKAGKSSKFQGDIFSEAAMENVSTDKNACSWKYNLAEMFFYHKILIFRHITFAII